MRRRQPAHGHAGSAGRRHRSHSADALWDFCYRVTSDEFHARDRHIRAKDADEVKKHEKFMRNMEERAGMVSNAGSFIEQ